MKRIFKPKIESNNNFTGKIIIHIILTIFGFIGTLVLVFWTGVQSTKEDPLITTLLNNPLQYLLICLIGSGILNVFYIRKNIKKLNIRSIEVDDENNTVVFRIQKFYSNALVNVISSKNDIEIINSENEASFGSKKVQIYQFKINGKLIGNIDKSDICWEKENILIKDIIQSLKKS